MGAVIGATDSVEELPWEASGDFEILGSNPTRNVLAFGGFGAGPVTHTLLARTLNGVFDASVYGRRLPGHGMGERAFRLLSMREIVSGGQFTFGQLYRQRPTPWILVGYSAGGLVATHLAARYPERVAALILVSPAFRVARRGAEPLSFAVNAIRLGLSAASLISTYRSVRRILRSDLDGAFVEGRKIVATQLGMLMVREVLSHVYVGHNEPTVFELDGRNLVGSHHPKQHIYPAAALYPLQKIAVRWYRRLDVPIFGAVAHQDKKVDWRAARRILEGNPASEIYDYPDSEHAIMVGTEWRRYTEDVTNFVGRIWI